MCVFNGFARCMSPSDLTKALFFRAVELALHLGGTLGEVVEGAPVLPVWEQDSGGDLQESREGVLDAPVVQVLLATTDACFAAVACR